MAAFSGGGSFARPLSQVAWLAHSLLVSSAIGSSAVAGVASVVLGCAEFVLGCAEIGYAVHL